MRKWKRKLWKRKLKWRYGLIPLFLLCIIGILALDRGEGVLLKLAWFLDPVYTYVMAQDRNTDELEEEKGNSLDQEEKQINDIKVYGDVQILYGDGYMESEEEISLASISKNQKIIEELWAGKDYQYLIRNFYIVDSSTYVNEDIMPVDELLTMDLSIVKENENPQILIHHTHTSETFIDSRPGVKEDTVVGMGTELARLLSEKYGYQVIHDKTAYDQIDGKLDRNQAYDMAKKGTESILEEYPSVQVIIDLHRDGGKKRVTEINGKDTAQIMMFNGLSRNMNGPIPTLYNPYLKKNLAFSLQLKLLAMSKWADYTKPIYLKGYEYNLSMMERSLLVEVGTEQNTVEEAKNAMEPLAEILAEVLE